MTNLQELLSKPVWQMTGEEFIFLSKHASGHSEVQPQPVTNTERKYVYGILGIAKLGKSSVSCPLKPSDSAPLC